jgi:ribosomal-protein-alanine N-acetyltransferase
MPLESARLAFRRFIPDDAAFIVALLNSPGWLRFIGDRGVRNEDDAHRYLANGPLASYARFGFGLYHVARKSDGASVGMCGLLKRDALEYADLGFAFLPEFTGQGYATEAGTVMLEHARRDFGLTHLAAITQPDNTASQRTLAKLGFRFVRLVRVPPADFDLQLHLHDLSARHDGDSEQPS